MDSARISAEIEKDLSKAGFDEAEVRRVEELSFAPASPAGDGGFDPALTAELFERPVSVPDFRSRKYTFIRGPLRAIAGSLFRLLVQVDEKLSENKVQSFYHVVHELIGLSHRFESLQARFGRLQEEVLRLKETAATGAGSQAWAFEPSVQDLPMPASETQRRNHRLAVELAALVGPGAAFVLDDSWGHFAAELRRVGFAAACSQTEGFASQATHRARDLTSHNADCAAALSRQSPGTQTVIAHLCLERLSGEPEDLPGLLASRTVQGGALALRWSAPGVGPFQMSPACVVNRAALLEVLLGLSFEVVSERAEESGSFELVLVKKA